jgi:hypothetical protein
VFPVPPFRESGPLGCDLHKFLTILGLGLLFKLWSSNMLSILDIHLMEVNLIFVPLWCGIWFLDEKKPHPSASCLLCLSESDVYPADSWPMLRCRQVGPVGWEARQSSRTVVDVLPGRGSHPWSVWPFRACFPLPT